MPNERILIIDDDQVVREALSDELSEHYWVDTASSGEIGLECLRKRRYDAVISDQRMPGIDGVTVLEQARTRDPDVVRILLTGYFDERAQRAAREPGAPFKIGKPWHDEVEITLRRAFEFRSQAQRLTGSVFDALAVAGVDDELSGAEGLSQIAEVLVERAMGVQGITSCEVSLELCGNQRVLAAAQDESAAEAASSDRWEIAQPITEDGSAQARLRGVGDCTAEVARFLLSRVRRWTGEDRATRLARRAGCDRDARARLNAVTRRATLGAMTASLMHELASVVQCMNGAMYEVRDCMGAQLAALPEAAEAMDGMEHSVKRAQTLFCAMRSFVHSGRSKHEPSRLAELVQSSVALSSAYLRRRATLRVGPIPEQRIDVNPPMFMQVLVNLLRNAADASPAGGFVDLEARWLDEFVEISVTDDGPGVPEHLKEQLFEPFVTTKSDDMGSGLGLSISSEIVAESGGTIRYERAPSRGARFVVSMPGSQMAR